MATVKELEAQIDELRAIMEAQGIRAPGRVVADDEPRPDYVAFGSPQHAALLGLVEVKTEEEKKDYFTFTSPTSKKIYRLADETESVRDFPAMDPEKSARHLLRQKVSSLESGPPPIPENAPPMWRPLDVP